MKLPKEKTSGKMSLKEIRMLLYGPPKIGKTTFLSGFPDAIFLATEKGYKALRVHKMDINSWNDFTDAVDLLTSKDHKFKTVIVDTADVLFDMCSEFVCDEMGIEHESDAEWGKGWNGVKKAFTRAIMPLFHSEMGIVFVSHTKGDKITTQVEEITKTIPTLGNAARKILLPLVDTIGCLRYKRYKGKDKEWHERLIISFRPSELIEVGDRTGLLPPELKLKMIPDGVARTPKVATKYAKLNYEIMASYYSRKKEDED